MFRAGRARQVAPGMSHVEPYRNLMSELRLLEYHDAWPSQFQQVAEELLKVFPVSGASIAHIGSTAVPGLCAKPVLDVLVGVRDLRGAEDFQHPLASLGYQYRPAYEDQLPGRRYFVRPEGKTLRVHLHSVLREGRLWQQHMQFRDALLRDERLLQQYAQLKRALAELHADNKAAYTAAKAPFIQRVLAGAGPLTSA
jgi:GrpB-like predicted nucleotidyltransferase (UPF0157 family)